MAGVLTSFQHLQGIDHLDFRPDKFGNQDIVGMVSAQVNFHWTRHCLLEVLGPTLI